MAEVSTVHAWLVARALRRIGRFSLGQANQPGLRLTRPPDLARAIPRRTRPRHQPSVLRRAFPGALLAAAALIAGGCGTGGKASSVGDQTNGKKLFTEQCAGCHTLADAGAKGTIGP